MSQAGTRSGKTYKDKSAELQSNFSDIGKKPKSKKMTDIGSQDDGDPQQRAPHGAALPGASSETPTGVSPTAPQTGAPQGAAQEVALQSVDPPGAVHDTTYQGKGVLPREN